LKGLTKKGGKVVEARSVVGKDNGAVLRGIRELKRFPVFSNQEIVLGSDGKARVTMPLEEATRHLTTGGLPGAIFGRAIHSEESLEAISAWWGEDLPIAVQKGRDIVTFVLG
jgi:hypothetical protein